jgi:hypothetical protein
MVHGVDRANFLSGCLFLVLKGVTEMSFLVLKRISGNSEENYLIFYVTNIIKLI